MTMMKKHVLKAIHEGDLESLLEHLGLRKTLDNGLLRCGNCERVVDLKSLFCLYPLQNDIKVCCNRRECYEQILSRQV